MPKTRTDLAFAPTLVKRQLRARGPMESAVVNAALDETHADTVQLGDIVNRLLIDADRRDSIVFREILTLRERVAELEALEIVRQRFDADAKGTLEFVTNFRDLSAISASAFNETRRLRVDPLYGQVTVPFNQYRSRFHITDPRSNALFVPNTLVTTVTDIDERSGTVTAGTPKNAFNGQNESYWQRDVAFDLASDVDTIEMRLDVEVPLDFAQHANVFTMHPYPLGQVDITNIQYSVDASEPTTRLPGFPTAGVNNAKQLRYVFAPLGITKLRISFRQRNWVERNGQKVFSYGAQEIDLALVEFDKTNEVALKNNNATVITVTAPTGFQFSQITNFLTDPNWEVAGSPSGIFVELYSDAALTNLQWASLTDTHPRSKPINLNPLSISTLYLVVGLKYQTSSSVSPVLTRLGLAYTVQT